MMRYRVFGGVLASPFPFPELREEPVGSTTDWTLHLVDGAAPAVASTVVGREEVASGIEAQICLIFARVSVSTIVRFDP